MATASWLVHFSFLRAHAYKRNGGANKIIDPDSKNEQLQIQWQGEAEDLLPSVQMPDRTSNDWMMIKEAFAGKVPHQIFSFTNIINYTLW